MTRTPIYDTIPLVRGGSFFVLKEALIRKREEGEASSPNTSEECLFILGDSMKTKVCSRCKKRKLIKNFLLGGQKKILLGRQKKIYFYHNAWCYDCKNEYQQQWREQNTKYFHELNKKSYLKRRAEAPWLYSYSNARCAEYNRGIPSDLTVEQVETLWKRDKAHLLKKPSIDRIDTDKHYTFRNCRFIELLENMKRKRGKRKWKIIKKKRRYYHVAR